MKENSQRAQLVFWTNESKTDTSRVVNVASVPQRSPFRYPGGKTWLVPRIRQWLLSIPKPQKLVEPFAGGSIVGLTAAFEGLAEQVILVEKDEQVAAVWQTIINDADGASWLANQIMEFKLSAETAKEILSNTPNNHRERAFQTIIQNRINHGGILAPGAGTLKNGENGKGLLSRWYPETLKKRILNIGKIRERIQFIEGDGLSVIRKFQSDINVAFFVDPPYTASTKKAGTRLYKYHQLDHSMLFKAMSRVKGDFLMTYDDADEVRALARENRFETRSIAMSNTHHATLNELLIGKDFGWLGSE
jgi:DNA adenine methylase